MHEVSEHDLNRSFSELEHLRELSKRLNFREDTLYWDEVIKQKTEKEQNAG